MEKKEVFVNEIQKMILNNSFPTKEDLFSHLKKISKLLETDYTAQTFYRDKFNIQNKQDLEKLAPLILSYYDNTKADISGLDLSNVSEFSNGAQDFTKMNMQDGSTIVLNDMDTRDFATEFKERQNASLENKGKDALLNAENIMKDMRQDKTEVNLQNPSDINKNLLNVEQARRLAIISKMEAYKGKEIIADPVNNVFIVKDTKEALFVEKKENGDYEVRKAYEVKANAEEVKVNQFEGANIDLVVTQITGEANYLNLSDSELVELVKRGWSSLTDEEIKRVVERLKEKREQKENGNTNEETVVTHEKRLSLTKPENSNAAFINTLLIAFISGLSFGIILFGIVNIIRK